MKRRARGGQKVVVAAGAIKEKLEISKLNFSIWSWNLFLYFFFQLPFAIMNLVFFGFAYLYLSFGDSIKAIADGDGIFSFVARVVGKVIEGTAKTISGAISFLSGGTIDLGKIFDGIASLPTDFYMVTQGIMMGFGLFVMLVVGLIYLSNGFNPLFGRGAALKTSTFILCLIGYVIPGLNLFPWVLLWTGAVWLNPR